MSLYILLFCTFLLNIRFSTLRSLFKAIFYFISAAVHVASYFEYRIILLDIGITLIVLESI